ncbi:hypothetical protein [Phenylobacterium soli]|uniref:hypothetical protein n=1 Tax=Phenylobacterium soli TaxID=2170551 RepID=UPI00361C46A4
MVRRPLSRLAVILAPVWVLSAAPAVAQPADAPPPPDSGLVTTAPQPPHIAPAPPEAPVAVAALAAPDAFTTPVRPTGLPPDLWRGTSLQVVQAVLPLLAERPLPPAAAALARRVLATGAQGPDGAAQADGLVAQRAQALMAQGDPQGAAALLARAPALDRDPGLARVAAESALLAGQDARACQIEQALTAGREDVYWVRLRTYCQAIAGQGPQAQLSFDLAQSQAPDPVFARLMGAKLAGVGSPGAPSMRNGLDYALSRNLGLDLSQAKPAPAVAAALVQGDPADPKWDVSIAPPDVAGAVQAIAAGAPLAAADLERLLDAADARDPKARARASAAALLSEPFAEPLGPSLRARMAGLTLPEGKAPAGRNLALEAAAAERRTGETALLALWTCAQAGSSELAPADRARIVRALRRAGLEADARAFALEGLLGLK